MLQFSSSTFIVLFLFPNLVWGAGYPACWIRHGECLDNNEPPLRVASTDDQVAIKPQINHNVVGDSLPSDSLDDCAEKCFDNVECRYFTWYNNSLSDNEKELEENPCHLVGFNLKQACFNLQKRCVLLRECSQFNDSCASCQAIALPLGHYYSSDTICEKAILQTGARPLIKPSAEPHTLILNGRTDNRHYKQEKTAQYTAVDAIELVNQNGSCPIPIPDLKQRIGPVAGFVDDHVIICGGFSMEEPLEYLSACQVQGGRYDDFTLKAWQDLAEPGLNKARAFASAVNFEVEFNNTKFYVLGGYNNADRFLDSIEVYDKNSGTFEEVTLKLPEAKSHFCTVFVEIKSLDSVSKYLYTIGGWNLEYLNSVHRIAIDASTGDLVGEWLTMPNLQQERSDHACALVQYVRENTWETGLMVAGGYKSNGAWTNTVEFFNFQTGAWVPQAFFPALKNGRHYHGLTTLGLIPTVFGGWNNGSLNSIEQLDYCTKNKGDWTTPKWVESQDWLSVAREHFASARVPNDFYTNCAEGLEEE